ncbi:MAG: hypothetical protein ACYS6W_15445 [Planctomycetota bacterium]
MGPLLRVERPNNSRRYYYNYNRQVLCGYDDSNSVKSFFIYGSYIDEVLLMKADLLRPRPIIQPGWPD